MVVRFFPLLPLLLVVACDASRGPEPLPFLPAGPEAAPAPSHIGPYPVGVRTLTFVDENRQTPGREGPRTLVCEVWYPAAETARGGVGESYPLYEQVPEDVRALLPTLDAEALGQVNTDAVRDAPARIAERFPVVVFSHGKGGVRMQSTFYTVQLASHGYVVIAPDHEGDTVADLLREGDVEITSTVDSYVLRPEDASFVLDRLATLDERDPLTPLLDLDRVGITGHSFGALTSFRTAGFDARIGALVAHTPVGIGLVNPDLDVKVEDFEIPTMIASGGRDETLPADLHADSVWTAMVPDKYHLHLPRAGHFTFSDLCVLDVEQIQAALGDEVNVEKTLRDGCGSDNVPTDVAFPIINHFSVGFFNTYLRGSAPSRAALRTDAAASLGAEEFRFDLVER
ncbi:MAG: alpha/beta hydrolase family protein [Myxococcota bacterium]